MLSLYPRLNYHNRVLSGRVCSKQVLAPSSAELPEHSKVCQNLLSALAQKGSAFLQNLAVLHNSDLGNFLQLGQKEDMLLPLGHMKCLSLRSLTVTTFCPGYKLVPSIVGWQLEEHV